VLENKNFAFFSKYFIGIFFQNTTSQRSNATNMKFIITLGLIMVATACAPSKCQNRLASLFGDMSSSEPSESNQINIFLIGNRFIYKPNKPSEPSKPVKELKNDQECGQVPVNYPRIVGGSQALRGTLPWQVTIQTISRPRSEFRHHCGGTIIGRRWILTAAHCFNKLGTSLTIKDLIVIAGVHDLDGIDDNPEPPIQSIKIERVFIHPRYRKVIPPPNDIALLKLSQDLRFDGYKQPACLPKLANENYDYAPGSIVKVSGWGSTKPYKSQRGSRRNSKVLQVITIPLISDAVCTKNHGNVVDRSMFCAGKLGVGGWWLDACHGDSGGPAVKKVNGKWTVLGITSWGSGCGAPNKPGVYTRVARFQQWIQDTIRAIDIRDN